MLAVECFGYSVKNLKKYGTYRTGLYKKSKKIKLHGVKGNIVGRDEMEHKLQV